ncbi:hypothetical protein MLD38_001851 [Melastoma candidum]|uniref:Uncharacterized protein n=1 Tax=Melastoma candidum TaxID=119954 RepID=A0ACB9SN55_9MYRT|nr:hypothetical protein MLD38_001851 [Melastoma candidum]
MVDANQFPMRLKEVSATILANIINPGINFAAIRVVPDNRTLVSEDIVHNLLHLISDTDPAIECKLLQVLVGLTYSPSTVWKEVSAWKTTGAIIRRNSGICFMTPYFEGLFRILARVTFILADEPGQSNSAAITIWPCSLDHTNDEVVEAAFAARCGHYRARSLDINAEGVRLLLNVLIESRTDNLRRRAVWAVERLWRMDDIASKVSGDRTMSTVLVDAFQHADYQTRQIAENAQRHINRIPNFSGIFPNIR